MPVFRDVHGRLYRIPSAQLQTFAIEAVGQERIEGVELPSREAGIADYIWPDGQEPVQSYEWPDGQEPLNATSVRSYEWPDGQEPMQSYEWPGGPDPLLASREASGPRLADR